MGSIAGAIWLPLVLNLAIGFALAAAMGHALVAVDNLFGRAAVRPFFYMPTAILALIFNSVAFVGVMRVGLGQTQRSFVFFSLGKQVWRVVAANLISGFMVALLVIIEAILLVVAFKMSGMPKLPMPTSINGWLTLPIHSFLICKVTGVQCPAPAVIAGLWCLPIAAICLWVYLAIRVVYFLPAVAIAENRISLVRSWKLSRSNFWRIVGLLVCTSIPVTIIFMSINFYLMPVLHHMHTAAAPHPLADYPALAVIWENPLGMATAAALGFASHILGVGLNVGGLVSVYRDVATEETSPEA
jgi:hypothetical protein